MNDTWKEEGIPELDVSESFGDVNRSPFNESPARWASYIVSSDLLLGSLHERAILQGSKVDLSHCIIALAIWRKIPSIAMIGQASYNERVTEHVFGQISLPTLWFPSI
jgi:hypothetical protein